MFYPTNSYCTSTPSLNAVQTQTVEQQLSAFQRYAVKAPTTKNVIHTHPRKNSRPARCHGRLRIVRSRPARLLHCRAVQNPTKISDIRSSDIRFTKKTNKTEPSLTFKKTVVLSQRRPRNAIYMSALKSYISAKSAAMTAQKSPHYHSCKHRQFV